MRGSGRKQSSGRARAAETVELDVGDEVVYRRLRDGREESVRWSNLEEVEVATRVLTRAIRAVDDSRVALVLAGADGTGVVAPINIARTSGLLARVAALPGFDIELFAKYADGEKRGRADLLDASLTSGRMGRCPASPPWTSTSSTRSPSRSRTS